MKSYYDYYVSDSGMIYRNNHELKQQTNNKGYKWINMSIKGQHKKMYVHRLVAMLYLENPENKPQVNHIDGNKTNNNVGNLEWCDNKYNQLHAIKTGLKKKVPKGDKNAKARKVKLIKNDGTFIVVNSLRSAVKYCNKEYSSCSSICHCCKGDIKTAFGYRWEYV